ncbi:hypothetical protein NDU88_002812 [Pleurodeles waltl]|uniref:Uncharacterized protein n=1 Tax=Pleurodeles waltl TaxID=8319 RepID=A0AAV7UAP8_PLEWA|nr:hypothetical protein NDU88_002812 [Pleurodeles waltl]
MACCTHSYNSYLSFLDTEYLQYQSYDGPSSLTEVTKDLRVIGSLPFCDLCLCVCPGLLRLPAVGAGPSPEKALGEVSHAREARPCAQALLPAERARLPRSRSTARGRPPCCGVHNRRRGRVYANLTASCSLTVV